LRSVLHLVISLCPACHAKVHLTRTVVSETPLLLELWGEQHTKGHESYAEARCCSSNESLNPDEEVRPTLHAVPLRERENLAHGLRPTCYTLHRQNEAYFGGLRERVLERDGYRYRVCDASGRDSRSITVHHRVPGKSFLHLMISLCPGCHAKVHRTLAVFGEMPLQLRELWREQHLAGHEQTALDFTNQTLAAQPIPLFDHKSVR